MNRTFVVETFHEKYITGKLVCFEYEMNDGDFWHDYEMQFSVNDRQQVNPLMSIREFEIPEMLTILSKVKDSIEKCEEKLAEEVLSYA